VFLTSIFFLPQRVRQKNLNLMEWDKLWTINKKMIDPVCARHTALLKDQHVLLSLTNGPEEPSFESYQDIRNTRVLETRIQPSQTEFG
jgi:hypothetical protein